MLKQGDTLKLAEKIQSAVKSRLEDIQTKFLSENSQPSPYSDDVVKTLARLVKDTRMQKAWDEISRKKSNGQMMYEVFCVHFNDDARFASLETEFKRRDSLSKKAGLTPISPSEKNRYFTKLGLIGGPEERTIAAALNLITLAASLKIAPPPRYAGAKGKKALQDEIGGAESILKNMLKIREFFANHQTESFDTGFFETIDHTMIPALERNLTRVQHPIYKKIQAPRSKEFDGLQSEIIIFHEKIMELFGPKTHLYSTIGNILSVVFDRNMTREDIRGALNHRP